MSERDAALGEKVRAMRIRRGLTQKELAGDRITRNMLSLIESGSASPSVSTLLWLSERLDMPVGYFFSDLESESRYLKLSVIDDLKEAFRSGRYADCVEAASGLPHAALDDEISAILAVSRFHTARLKADRFALRSASAELDEAEAAAAHSLYCGEPFFAAIRYARSLLEAAAADGVSDALCGTDAVGPLIPYAVVAYFRALRDNRPDPAGFEKGSHFERHLNALQLGANGRGGDSIKRLRELSLDASLPFYMQYRVLCDLERAANAADDLRLAYSSSRRKIELIDKMKF